MSDIFNNELFEAFASASDNVFIICHQKSGLYNTSDTCNGAVSFSVIMQLHDPLLGIRYLNIPYLPIAEILFLNQVKHKIVSDFGIVAYTLLQADIAFQ